MIWQDGNSDSKNELQRSCSASTNRKFLYYSRGTTLPLKYDMPGKAEIKSHQIVEEW